MSWQVVNLPPLIPTTTGANSVTNGIGNLDDAESITLYFVSTANASSTTGPLTLQVSQFDPAIPLPVGVTQSTVWNSISTNLFSTAAAGQVTSSGAVVTIAPIGFRGMRLTGLASGISGQVVAYVSKTIFV